MVDRHIEESLYLIGMQIHGYNPVYTRCTQQVCHELCTDAHTWFVLTILTSPTEVWYHCNDVTGRGTLCRIDHQQELHEVVGVREGALYEEYIASTDGLLIAHCKLSVREFCYHQFTQRTSKALTDFLSQIPCLCS